MDTKKLRQKILDLAIHGKLVPQDPNDEPASVLLERIRSEKEKLIKEGKIKAPKKSKTPSDRSHYPKEGPWELPDGWCWSCLGEISDYGKCITVPVSAIKDDEWVLELEDIEKDTGRLVKQIIKRERSISGSRYAFFEGQVLFSKLRTYLNKVLIAPSNGYCTTEIIPISPYSGISPEYLNLVLRSPYFLDYTAQCGYGVKMPRLGTLDAIKALIPIPPHEEQRRIVESVDNYSDIIEQIQTEKECLVEYVSACKSVILELATHGKLVPQDPNDEPAIELLKRINPDFKPSDNLHYGSDLPAGWICGTYGELNQHKNKSVNPMDSPQEYFELYSVPIYDKGKPEYLKGKEIGSTKQSVDRGDVLLCKINPHLNRSWVVGHYRTDLTCIASSEWLIFHSPALMPEYARLFFISPEFRLLMLSNVSGVGGSLMRARASAVDKYPIWIPPIKEQERIVFRVKALNSVLDSFLH